MAKKFKKKIVTPGTPTVGRLDGTEEKEAITPARIKTWVANTKKLQSLGVLIPGPLAHQDKNKRFALPVIKAKDGETLADAYSGATPEIPPAWDLANLNAGFWEDFDIDPTDNSLIGTLNVENQDKENAIGTDVKQTSILVMPERTITDREGNEHKIGEHLAHVACCIHAQEPGQPNFEPLSPVPAGMAMSFVLARDEITGLPDPTKPKDEQLYKVITLLRSALNVALPEDTSRENFLDSLVLVLTQKLADEQESQREESVSQRPQGAENRTPSIAMSQTTQTPPAQKNTVEAILMSQLIRDKRKVLKDRVQKLVDTGRIGKDYADKNLFPKVVAFSMSAADLTESGEFPKGSLEDLIEGLEQATPLVGESLLEQEGYNAGIPSGAVVTDLPQDVISGQGVAELSDAQMNELLDSAIG